MNLARAGSLLIVSGAPGTGKSSLAARLAAETPNAVQLRADVFFEFLVDPIAPVRPESQAQNEAVLTAVARAAGAYAQAGYAVFLDGVVGPWFLPLFRRELPDLEIDYLVLRAPLATAIRRAVGRAETPAPEPVVRAMHPKFEALGALEPHALATGERSLEALASEVRARRADGTLRLGARA